LELRDSCEMEVHRVQVPLSGRCSGTAAVPARVHTGSAFPPWLLQTGDPRGREWGGRKGATVRAAMISNDASHEQMSALTAWRQPNLSVLLQLPAAPAPSPAGCC
jgi:hypothetical protein